MAYLQIKIHHPDAFRKKQKSLNLFALFSFTLLCITASLSSFTGNSSPPSVLVKDKFVIDLDSLYKESTALYQSFNSHKPTAHNIAQIRNQFIKTKLAYKKVEFLIEYLDPSLVKKLNGSPLPKVLIEQEKYQALKFMKPSFRSFPPEGLQVLEEILFAEEYGQEINSEAKILANTLKEQILLFINTFNKQSLSDRQILESCREELIRIMTLGISGFDPPAAGEEISFCAEALESVVFAVKSYQSHSSPSVISLSQNALAHLEKSLQYLQSNDNFETFDRLYFVRELADPAFASVTILKNELAPSSTSVSKPVSFYSTSLFGKDFLQAGFFAKQDGNIPDKAITDLGKLLFFDPLLSGNNQRSCASCHHPAKAFTDGTAKSVAFDMKGTVSRNSPTLINAVFSNSYFWDSRAQYLQDQVPAVLLKFDELHGSYESAIEKLSGSKEYKYLFKAAFPDHKDQHISVNTINRAIAAYVQSLVALDSPFDKFMRREIPRIDESVKKGFNLFTGKAGCATCHFAPIFNGTVPPQYLETETEVLGIPDKPDFTIAKLDPDSGKASYIPAKAFMHSFKTPTIRNISLTAPYMHNGVFETLEEVVDFYDIGGGAAFGFHVPNQTLPSEPLNLTAEEKNDLIAFMHSLTDTTYTTDIPLKLPAFKKDSPYNERPVGGSY